MRLRFARVFQFDPAHPGTDIQRAAMVEALTYQIGTDWDRVNLRLARTVKAIRPFILIGFHPDMGAPALHSPAGINFNDRIDPAGIEWFAPHEAGHQVEHYLLTDADKTWFMAAVGRSDWGMMTQEMFCDAFRDWKNGTAWPDMTPILLP